MSNILLKAIIKGKNANIFVWDNGPKSPCKALIIFNSIIYKFPVIKEPKLLIKGTYK